MTILNKSIDVRNSCPGCRSANLLGELELRSTPVVLNYRFTSAEESKAVARGRMLLRQCGECGLVFNAAFDPSLTPYDERYENTQCCSNAFQTHLNSLADSLADSYGLNASQILEVGCGKGDFLKLLCKKTNATGHGYDTSCEQNGWTKDGVVCFYQRYLLPGEIKNPAGLIICRHVVEHVAEIGDFLGLLFEISVDAGNAPVYIETPDWDWTVAHDAHWDIFYEHCNYFSMPALANLARRNGFEVIRHTNVFGGQYQALEIQPSISKTPFRDAKSATSLETIAQRLVDAKESMSVRIQNAYRDKAWAIWGAGAKGVCLANTIEARPPSFVIDSNPAKQRGYIPGTALEVVSPHDARLCDLEEVLVVNPNYLSEIKEFSIANSLSFNVSSL